MGSIDKDCSKDLPIRRKPVFEKLGRDQFMFDPEWRNLNHGSFGTYPKAIREKFREYQDASESRPDVFIRYDYPRLLDESREAVAKIINAPADSVVFVANATAGVNTVYRNLKWNPDGKDVIVSFSTIYEACGKVADYLVDYYEGSVSTLDIPLTYPIDDSDIIQKFRNAVKEIEASGKRARICTFDVVSSRPGVVFPWEELVRVCKELNVISMVDGAQGIGMVKLDLTAADPDFFVSNCHKWLHVPRGCAVFYVPKRNQHLLPTTLATSHGYVPKSVDRMSPLPPSKKSPFITNFEFVGTCDNSPYLCVKDAIQWRHDVLGGEDKVLEYLWDLNKKGIELVAEALQTEYMENSTGTMRNCGMANVALPIWVDKKGPKGKEDDSVIPIDDTQKALYWIQKVMVDEYKTYLSVFIHGNRFWVRFSAQVYLDLDDYKWGANILGEICDKTAKQEYL